MIITLYLILGIVWTVFVFNQHKTLRKSQREYWFPIILFSVTLWPFFMYFNYDRGVLFGRE